MMGNIEEIKRGEIYMANLPKVEGTSIQWGIRPVLVISNEMCNEHSTVINVVPITSSSTKRYIPTHIGVGIECGLKLESTALCEQIMLIQKDILFKKVGQLGGITMSKINKAILIQVGLMQRQPVYA